MFETNLDRVEVYRVKIGDKARAKLISKSLNEEFGLLEAIVFLRTNYPSSIVKEKERIRYKSLIEKVKKNLESANKYIPTEEYYSRLNNLVDNLEYSGVKLKK